MILTIIRVITTVSRRLQMNQLKRLGWYDALLWLAYSTTGFIIPVVGGILVALAFGAQISVEWIAGGGQFAVSSAGLLMTTTYFVSRPRSILRLPLTEWLVLLSILGLFLGAIFFALATVELSGETIDSRYYQWPSIGLFGAALLIAFVAVGLDNLRDLAQRERIEQYNIAARNQVDQGLEATFRRSSDYE